MKTILSSSNGVACGVPARSGEVGDCQRRVPYAGVGGSLIYAAPGLQGSERARRFCRGPGAITQLTIE